MIDLKLLRTDPERFRASLGRKRYRGEDLDAVLEQDAAIRRLRSEIEAMRAARNAASKKIPQAAEGERGGLLTEMKALAASLKEGEPELRRREEELQEALQLIPNPPDPSAPDGAGDEENAVLKTIGEPRSFPFPPLDHLDLGEERGWIDVKRAARAAGTRFAYLLGDLVDLEMALVRFALDTLKEEGFQPVVPPILVREAAMYGTGFLPADRNEIYKIEGEDAYLVGTSEVSLAALHMDEILEGDLPRRYAGFSTCLRKEAGSYGKDTRGIFRVHQFDKVEMFSFCAPEESGTEHDAIRRPGSTGREEVRPGGLDAGPVRLQGSDVVLQLHRLPGSPAGRAAPRERRPPAASHPQRHRGGGGPHHHRAAGESPGGRPHGAPALSPAALHGAAGQDLEERVGIPDEPGPADRAGSSATAAAAPARRSAGAGDSSSRRDRLAPDGVRGPRGPSRSLRRLLRRGTALRPGRERGRRSHPPRPE
jgi:seryl-tRNA synthetase